MDSWRGSKGPGEARTGDPPVAAAAASSSASAGSAPASTEKSATGGLWTSAPEGLEDIEISLCLEAIYRHYGLDFRSYAMSSLRRRLKKRLDAEGLQTISGLQEKVLHDPRVMERLMLDLSISVTSMFRDPTFFKAIREHVIPTLRTYPFVRVWHAGCATGEEVYSMAILLKEEGLYDRARIYATDINDMVLHEAKRGIFPLAKMQEYTANYLKAGGKTSFSNYYTARYGGALFDPSLVTNVVFSQHNLVTDRCFSEFHLILCRNVMIYFDRTLQSRVLELFHESLVRFGVLGIGRKETLRMSSAEAAFEAISPTEKLYRKVTGWIQRDLRAQS